MDQLWMIYSTMWNQILQSKAMRVKLYYSKVIVVTLLFIYSIQVQTESRLVFQCIVFSAPIIALLFDFHIRARDKSIKRDGIYMERYIEPLLDQHYDPNEIYKKANVPTPSKKFTTEKGQKFLFPEAYYRYASIIFMFSNRRLERYSHYLFTFAVFIAAILVYNDKFPT